MVPTARLTNQQNVDLAEDEERRPRCPIGGSLGSVTDLDLPPGPVEPALEGVEIELPDAVVDRYLCRGDSLGGLCVREEVLGHTAVEPDRYGVLLTVWPLSPCHRGGCHGVIASGGGDRMPARFSSRTFGPRTAILDPLRRARLSRVQQGRGPAPARPRLLAPEAGLSAPDSQMCPTPAATRTRCST